MVIATPASGALIVAAAMPGARIIALPESPDGSPTLAGLELLQPIAEATEAALAGPGMSVDEGTLGFAIALLPIFENAVCVLDARAMDHLGKAGACHQSASARRTPAQAAVWGGALHARHARAGLRLSERVGALGFLARDLAAEVPPLMHQLST